MTKKTRIRIGIVMVITCVMCFSDWSFAQATTGGGEKLDVIGFSLNYIVCVLGRLWVFFAKLAGTFLTNNWVYGEILGIDALMWKYRNVMKNIANFGLGFYFVYAIFKGLIGKEDITQKLKKIILWLLIAGVGIQASWFFTAAVIDVSTITLSAVGSFPSQVISGDPYLEKTYEVSLKEYITPINSYTGVGKELSLFPKEGQTNFLETKYVTLEKQVSVENLIDSLMPNADDVSGPLYYIGFSILKTNVVTSINTTNENSIKATIFNTIIQGGTTIIFAIEMLVLCVLALMRIVYLWMFIILSPLAVLLRCIEKSGQKLGGDDKSFISKLMKQINFKSFFINVFKPTVIVLGFGIAVLFVSLMNSVVINSAKKTFELNGATVTSTPNPRPSNNEEGDQTYTTTIDNNLLSFTLANAGKTLLEIILSIMTVLIIYFILKFVVKFGEGKDFVSKGIGDIQKEVGSLMESIPIVPVSGYDKEGNPKKHYISAGKVFGLGAKTSLAEEIIDKYHGDVREKIYDQENIIESWIGNKNKLSSVEKRDIEREINRGIGLQTLDGVKGKIIKTEEGKGMTLGINPEDGGFWKQQFGKWLTNQKGTINNINKYVTKSEYQTAWSKMVQKWDKLNKDKNKSLDEKYKAIFEIDKAAAAYADFFGLSSLGITSWLDLANNGDISKTQSTGNQTGQGSTTNTNSSGAGGNQN